ncbi:MAG TPA: PRC-barrel domain-containing protein [Acidimicrobiales bacterium]|nr:PRC-barrel domain-containing protein [Acidimicrobiales bacterium]
MSDSFRSATGRKVVSRASAADLGMVSYFLVDVGQRRIASVVVGRGKKARLVDWAQVSGFGPDAVMVSDEGALRPAAGDREQAAADGKLDMLGKRTLTERGNKVGTIGDVTFDPATGVVEMLQISDRTIPADTMLGSGTYAVVVDASQEPVP